MNERIVSKKFGPSLPNLVIVSRVEEIYPKLNEIMGLTNVTQLRSA
jgi:hypothetical protein